MTHASLFSGIGGPEVAAAMLGWDNAFHCEINDFCRKILKYHFPNSKSYLDVKKTDFTEWRGRIDVLTGGFPCQPFSYAGERRGAEDDRYLWPEFKRVISEIRPTWVVGENVSGITTMVEPGEVTLMGGEASLFCEEDTVNRYKYEQPFTIERVCSDLEQLGYTVQPMLIPACAVGAPHRRDRVFIIANIENAMFGRQLHGQNDEQGCERNIGNIGTGSCERVCAEVSRIVATDTIGCGKGTPRESGSTEKDGRDTNSQQGERRAETERDNRFHEFLRTTPDTASIGGREIHEHMEPELAEGNEPFGNGRERTAADTAFKYTRQQCEFGCREYSDTGASELGNGHSARTTEEIPTDADIERLERAAGLRVQGHEGRWQSDGVRECPRDYSQSISGLGRWDNFPSVSPVHRGNDGLPFDVDSLTISFGKWRTESLKAYGNAIVPQVMYEIFRAIEIAQNDRRK